MTLPATTNASHNIEIDVNLASRASHLVLLFCLIFVTELHVERYKLVCQQRMSSAWIDQVRSSHNLQLAATAVASGLLVGSAILGLQKAKQQYRVSDLKSSIPDLDKDENVIQVCVLVMCLTSR